VPGAGFQGLLRLYSRLLFMHRAMVSERFPREHGTVSIRSPGPHFMHAGNGAPKTLPGC
jgi:hypothetical protein